MIKSIEQLNVKLQQKNIVVVSGNVYDSFAIPKQGGGLKITNIDEIIKEKCVDMGYETIVKFSPSIGVQTLKGVEKEKAKGGKKDEFDDLESDADKITINNFITNITAEISDRENPRCVYVIDFADIYFDSKVQGETLENIAGLLSAVLQDKPRSPLEISEASKSSKVVLISRDGGNLLNFVAAKNIELAQINMLKPNIQERKAIFVQMGSNFDVTNSDELKKDGNVQDEAIGLTDGFSCKEIIQLGRVKPKDQSLTFKELFSLAQFNKKDSEWEKINPAKLSELKKVLSERVLGQQYAIDSVYRTLVSSFLGMNGVMHSENLTKPKGILFFAGPTGTGKTELAKAIAKFVFGDETKLIRFDMSEYNHEHSDQRLIGAPPGYVGYDGGGELTNKVKDNPFSVLLFDEVEKANGKILDKFLQILEDGRLTSSKGELIDFSETFIIFTSNIGAKDADPNKSEETNRKAFIDGVSKYFKETLGRPELLNRIGSKNIIPFNFISDPEIISGIIAGKIEKVSKSLLKKHNIVIKKEDSTIHELSDFINDGKKYETKMGGRGVGNAIEEYFVDVLSDFIFENYEVISKNKKTDKITNISFGIKNNKVNFKII